MLTDGSPLRRLRRRFFRILVVSQPILGIRFDVGMNAEKLFFSVYNVFIITALPDGHTISTG